jgi:hypothetical protein
MEGFNKKLTEWERLNNKNKIMTPIPDDKWLSYEDFRLQQELMARQEVKVLYEMGLGWLVEFCVSFDKNNKK